MNVSKILKSVKEEVSGFLADKKTAKKVPPKYVPKNKVDRFVKSNSNDLLDIRARTRYVNGICYGGDYMNS